MDWQYNPYVIPVLVAAFISMLLAVWAWRYHHAPGAIPFSWLMLAQAEWSLGYALELLSVGLPAKFFWTNLQYLGVVCVPFAWLVLALEYTGLQKWLTRRNLILLTTEPAITLLLIWSNGFHGLFRSDVRLDISGPFPSLVATFEIWFWINAIYSYILILLGTTLLLQMLVRSPLLYRGQAAVLLIGVLAPWVGNALYINGLNPFPHLDLTLFGFTITGVALAWGLFRFRLLNIAPVARSTVIEGMPHGVVVLDAQGRIVDLNPAAASLLACVPVETVGKPVTQVLSRWTDLTKHFPNIQRIEEICKEIVFGEGVQERHFELQVSFLDELRGKSKGYVMVFHDITAQVKARDALKCLSDEMVQRARRLSLVNEISLAINQPLSLEILLQIAADGLAGVFKDVGVDQIGLALFDEEKKYLKMVAECADPDRVSTHDMQICVAENPSLKDILTTHRPLAITDAKSSPISLSNQNAYCDQQMQSVLIVPMIVRDETIGVLECMTMHGSHFFTSEEIDLTTTVANLVAARIELARLFDAESNRRHEAELLRKTQEALSSDLDLHQVLDNILIHLEELVPYDSACIFLLRGDRLHAVAGRGFSNFEEVVDQYYSASDDALFQEILHSANYLILPNAQTDPRFKAWGDTCFVQGWIGMPLIVRGTVIGCLTLDNHQSGAYGEKEAALVQAFATQAAIAIDNARLFGEVQELATTDGLTGIANRYHLFAMGEREFRKTQRSGSPLSAVMLDIDCFKQVNDTYGHAVGDQVLQEIAKRCQTNIRNVDILGRYGGEEFVIILTDTDTIAACVVAERLRKHIEENPILTDAGEACVTVSLGIAGIISTMPDLSTLLDCADTAMYAAKRKGRNRVEVWQA